MKKPEKLSGFLNLELFVKNNPFRKIFIQTVIQLIFLITQNGQRSKIRYFDETIKIQIFQVLSVSITNTLINSPDFLKIKIIDIVIKIWAKLLRF